MYFWKKYWSSDSTIYLLFLSCINSKTFTCEIIKKNSQKEKWPVLKKASLYGRQEGRRFEDIFFSPHWYGP